MKATTTISNTETILCKLSRYLFNPLLIPIYLFAFISINIPFTSMILKVKPQLMIIPFIWMLFSAFLLPFSYIKYAKYKQLLLSHKEILMFSFIINLLNIFILNKLSFIELFLPIKATLFLINIMIILLFIISFFTNIDLYCSSITLFFTSIILLTPKISFSIISISLLILGAVLSLYLANNKSTIRTIIFSVICSLLSCFVFNFFIW